MKQRRRIYYSAAQRAEIWDRWKAGESMSSIGRRFDRESSSVFSVLSPTGGIRPPDRKRASQALSLGEREEISRGLSTRCSLRGIARLLGRSASTISREVRRNGGAERYRATGSDQAAWDRALRPKRCKLACRPALARTVSGKLRRNWSPAQIAGWLKRTWPGEPHNQVSHETIYRSLFIQTRGVLKKELLDHLRARRTIPPLKARHPEAERPGPDQGRRLDQRTARVGRGSRRARPLGRRPDRRVQQQLRRDARRAPLALRHAGQGRQQGHRERRHRPDQTVEETASRTLQIPDLGPRQGAG